MSQSWIGDRLKQVRRMMKWRLAKRLTKRLTKHRLTKRLARWLTKRLR